MKLRTATLVATLIIGAVVLPSAQDHAAVKVVKPEPFHAGGPLAFKVKLNEPLPKGAHFDFRVSPVTVDEEIPLGGGQATDASQREFLVTGLLPEGAVPGQWHISVIYLFLPGSGWTHNTIAPNDLRFQVEGKAFPIPTKAEVSVGH